MDALEGEDVLLGERFGGADIGLHHELLDQLVGVEALAHGDGRHLARLVHVDAPLGQFDGERGALFPALEQRLVGGVEIAEFGQHGLGYLARLALEAFLRLPVGQPRVGAHDAPVEAVRDLAAIAPEPHLDGHAGAVLVRAQGTQVRAELVRQHGHDLIGQVDAVAALLGFPVERGAGRDEGGHVRDGDPDGPRAVVSRNGEHRVVEILGVHGIDGDQREVAQVLPRAADLGHLGGLGLRDRLGRELSRDAVLFEADEGRDLGAVRAVHDLHDARLAPAAAPGGGAVAHQHPVVGRERRGHVAHGVVVACLLADGLDAPAPAMFFQHAEKVAVLARQLLHHHGGGRLRGGLDAREGAVAHAQRGGCVATTGPPGAVLADAERGRLALPAPRLGPAPEFAVIVHAVDANHGHGRQIALHAVGLAALGQDELTVLDHATQHAPQFAPIVALDTQLARDGALVEFVGALADEIEDVGWRQIRLSSWRASFSPRAFSCGSASCRTWLPFRRCIRAPCRC